MGNIKLDSVSKYFIDKKSNTAIAALYHINLNIPRNTFTVVTGPSGCGKTTLLKIIAGLYLVDEGQIFFNDDDVTSVSPNKRNCAFVSQAYALYPHMSIFDNIAYPLKQASIPVEEIKRRVGEISTLLQLNLFLSRKPKVLSGGQQQRVALARAIVKHPNILLLDEPLSNLDESSRLQIRELLKTLQKKLNLSIVIVTHHEADAHYLADLLIHMDNGSILSVESKVASHD